MTARLGGVLAASGSDVPLAFVGLGAVLVVLATLAALADRFALTAIPFYLLAGLAIGGKDKGEAENEQPPVDVHSLLP